MDQGGQARAQKRDCIRKRHTLMLKVAFARRARMGKEQTLKHRWTRIEDGPAYCGRRT